MLGALPLPIFVFIFGVDYQLSTESDTFDPKAIRLFEGRLFEILVLGVEAYLGEGAY